PSTQKSNRAVIESRLGHDAIATGSRRRSRPVEQRLLLDERPVWLTPDEPELLPVAAHPGLVGELPAPEPRVRDAVLLVDDLRRGRWPERVVAADEVDEPRNGQVLGENPGAVQRRASLRLESHVRKVLRSAAVERPVARLAGFAADLDARQERAAQHLSHARH